MTAVPFINPRFWDQAAAKYAAKPVADVAAYEASLNRVRSYLAPEHRVLEIGCGTGTTALTLARHVAELTATDVSPKMLEIARQKARDANVTNVTFRVGTLDDASLTPGSYDVVMAFNLVHLLEDIPGAMRRAAELLKPGGMLLTKTPCIGELGVLVKIAIPVLQWFGKAPFVNFVTQPQLEAAVRDADLAVLEQGLYPVKSRSLFIAARKN
jgi:2-polyprenyl-3-methyl-5-hydroxy-6-metoxy-1,4-benzoquinol methylase